MARLLVENQGEYEAIEITARSSSATSHTGHTMLKKREDRKLQADETESLPDVEQPLYRKTFGSIISWTCTVCYRCYVGCLLEEPSALPTHPPLGRIPLSSMVYDSFNYVHVSRRSAWRTFLLGFTWLVLYLSGWLVYRSLAPNWTYSESLITLSLLLASCQMRRTLGTGQIMVKALRMRGGDGNLAILSLFKQRYSSVK